MRRAILLLLAALSSACSSAEAPPGPAASPAPAAAPALGRLFVTNESGGDISVVDVGTQQVVATIPVGKRPRGIRLSPDGTLLYVALSGSPIAPPGVDESTLPPADKKADGIGVVSIKDLKLLRVLQAGSDPEQTAVTQRRPASVRGQRGHRPGHRDLRSRTGASSPRSRWAASPKAWSCGPTAASCT